MNGGDVDVQLRHRGRDDRRDVRKASVEPDGEMSIVLTEAARPARGRDLAADPAA
jgi:uncharacterized membrane protein YcaP (DUF421 family)